MAIDKCPGVYSHCAIQTRYWDGFSKLVSLVVAIAAPRKCSAWPQRACQRQQRHCHSARTQLRCRHYCFFSDGCIELAAPRPRVSRRLRRGSRRSSAAVLRCCGVGDAAPQQSPCVHNLGGWNTSKIHNFALNKQKITQNYSVILHWEVKDIHFFSKHKICDSVSVVARQKQLKGSALHSCGI